MLPLRRGSPIMILAVLAGAVAAVGLVVVIGPLLSGAAMMPAALLLSLLAGAAIACYVEYASLRPLERYRRNHAPLAGPRRGARL